uniref:E3 ubiquitin-protein ligase ZNRF1 n=1 Tax=Zeugodacus cucurbitae TaxID=28588 RepID=A0A0A1WNG9_ZEUCU
MGQVFGNPNNVHGEYPTTTSKYVGIKCPVCNKFVLPDDIECHLVMCLTKPRLSYNEDVLSDAKGECVICLEDLNPGDIIARLPCLCIYHKGCIDRWFEVNRSCPEHPGD